MRVYLLRHGERQNSRSLTSQSDPGLSARGLKQAEAIAAKVSKGDWDQPDRVLCSPRLRSQLTLSPLSIQSSCNLQILTALDERTSEETAAQFTNRVRKFLHDLESLPGVNYLCSHLDWIEEAMISIPSSADLLKSQYHIWEPGSFMVFDLVDGIWEFRKAGGIQA